MLARWPHSALKQPASLPNRAPPAAIPHNVSNPLWRLGGAALEAAALALGQATPDPEPLVVGQRVLEAFGLDRAGLADALGRAGGAALLREEAVGVLIQAGRPLVPGLDLDGDGAHPLPPQPVQRGVRSHGYGCLERHDRNYIGGILRRLEWQFQAEGLILWTGRSPWTGAAGRLAG